MKHIEAMYNMDANELEAVMTEKKKYVVVRVFKTYEQTTVEAISADDAVAQVYEDHSNQVLRGNNGQFDWDYVDTHEGWLIDEVREEITA